MVTELTAIPLETKLEIDAPFNACHHPQGFWYICLTSFFLDYTSKWNRRQQQAQYITFDLRDIIRWCWNQESFALNVIRSQWIWFDNWTDDSAIDSIELKWEIEFWSEYLDVYFCNALSFYRANRLYSIKGNNYPVQHESVCSV